MAHIAFVFALLPTPIRDTLKSVPNRLTTSPAAALPTARAGVASLALLLTLALSGCSYFRQKAADRYVYVTAKQVFLRDRVAAVSNRTGTAVNGEKLVVLDRTRRAIKVRTPRGEVGWVEEKLTADQKTANQFAALHETHANDPVVATATARDEGYLHVAPGRETPFFYRVAEGDNLSLLERATVPKNAVPPAPTAPAKEKDKDTPDPAADAPDTPAAPAAVLPPPVMEDWWLVRNARGQTGWILSRRIDVSAPDALARYAEGQRIVGAYVLANVDDPDSGFIENGNTITRIPEYVTFLSPYKAGLPYDFDQIRVFIWNIKKHRYETGFRESHVVGYLPASVGSMKDKYGTNAVAQATLPSFTYKVLPASAPIPVPDPVTGISKPSALLEKTYRLEGNICRRILPPNTPAEPQARPPDAPDPKSGKSKKKHKP
jgi:uncharacterized protein YgiM (DUF1202 family)